MRLLLRWSAPLLLALALCAPAWAQATAEGETAERAPPAMQYAVAMLYALIVLVIVCMPSRKA
jgi:hypothetical protein